MAFEYFPHIYAYRYKIILFIKLYYLSRILYYIVCKNSIIFCDILLKKQKTV